MDEFVATETLVIELLLVVSVVAIVVRRMNVPYTVALVVVGLLITFEQGPQVNLTSDLILLLFVPPLVFEAAFHIGFDPLRDDLVPILTLAIPGVLLTTGIVALAIVFGLSLPLTTGLVFGALISATDPVAIVALFHVLNVPKRLAVLIEGESLLNDGTAVVVFNLVLAAALAGMANQQAQAWPLELLAATVDFARISLGGVGIGIGLGWLISQLIARIDDYLIETTLTTIVAFGSYLVADWLGVSGVLAVVGAGIVVGNVGPAGMSPTTRIVLFNFWEYLAFVANSLVFLLIGLQVNIPQVVENLGRIAVAVLAVIVSRAIVVYGLTWLTNRRSRPVPLPYQHVQFWGGLRGAIGLALALGLPAELPDRELLQIMAFGVVLFTLLVQGTTIRLLLRRLGMGVSEPIMLEYERYHGRLMAARASRDRLQQLHRDGVISAATFEQLAPEMENQIRLQIEGQRELLRDHPELQTEELEDARREGLRARRAVLAAMMSDGLISEQTYDELVSEVDTALEGDVEPDSTESRPM